MTAANRPTLVDVADTPRLVVTPAPRIGLGPGETALAGGVVFFATLGVGGLASSVSGIGGFFMGMGWLIVLWLTYQWAQTVEREADAAAAPSVPSAATSYEAWHGTHDLRDFATIACRYGCEDPTTCRWPHVDCQHCFKARQAARRDGR